MKCVNFNKDWIFQMPNCQPVAVNIPHTWNGVDGQDGGSNYKRCACRYVKKFARPNFSQGESCFVVFNGVNSECRVFLNGRQLAEHKGGYSRFAVDITNHLERENELLVIVTNEANAEVYPQRADFTFYGGIYRDVTLQIFPKNHFAYGDFCAHPLKVTPTVNGADGTVTVETNIQGSGEVNITVLDAEGNSVANGKSGDVLTVKHVHLWNGIEDPYLYTVKADLVVCGKIEDTVQCNVGFRTFEIDAERGFILNGRSYPLRGVSRHQDRPVLGNAITATEHDEDITLILETGANSVRLAHYQHDNYFYDLCDKFGLLVWAEVPYITQEMTDGKENVLSQMRELVCQCYNHPSIYCWGLSNEITSMGLDAKTVDVHDELISLVKSLDKTRPTSIAHISKLPTNDKFVETADLCAYNLYFGWYEGGADDYISWFERFRKEHPALPVGLSEYGADGMMRYQTAMPTAGDYTETYQSLLHEKVAAQIDKMPYLVCSYVWNMFDFASDSRNEGGEPGINHKGLVTFDRKVKKDSFYLYKAYWSKQPFVHIAGKRYVYRNEQVTKIKVYSNLNEVSLYKDGVTVATKTGKCVFEFEVDITSKHKIEAKSANYYDCAEIEYTAEKHNEYICAVDSGATNWLGSEWDSSCYSVNDKIGDIAKTKDGSLFLTEFFNLICARKSELGEQMPDGDIIKKMAFFSLKKIVSVSGYLLSDEEIKKFTNSINKIKRESD